MDSSFILLYIFVPLAVAVLYDLIKYATKVLFMRGSLSIKQKRISILLQEYFDIKHLCENDLLLAKVVTRDTIIGLRFFLGVIVQIGVFVLIPPEHKTDLIIIVVLLLISVLSNQAYSKWDKVVRIIKASINFDSYRIDTVNRLMRLGGRNAEELKIFGINIEDSSDIEEFIRNQKRTK